jgi:hypothetical protein
MTAPADPHVVVKSDEDAKSVPVELYKPRKFSPDVSETPAAVTIQHSLLIVIVEGSMILHHVTLPVAPPPPTESHIAGSKFHACKPSVAGPGPAANSDCASAWA